MDMEYSPKPHTTYQVEGYTDEIVQDFEQRLDTIFGRQVNRVHVLDFARMTEEMRKTLVNRMRMVYTWAEGHELFTSHAWRRLFEIRGPLVREFILEFFSTSLGLHTAKEMAEDGFEVYCISGRGQAPKKVTAIDLFYLRSMDQGMANVLYLLAQYLFRHAEGRKSGALIIEYLVKISKKARILELKRRHLKITVLTSYTPYPSRKIWRICACTSQETTKIQSPIRRIQENSIHGAFSVKGSGAGIVLISPTKTEYMYALRLNFESTNNQAEYEALLAGLRIAKKIENQKADVLSKLASVAFNHLTKEILVETLDTASMDIEEINAIVEEEGET
ncbi:uncharacterized mitochondrial protein-like protein [Tanacetum coccineum]